MKSKLILSLSLSALLLVNSCKKTDDNCEKTAKDSQPNQILSLLNFTQFNFVKLGTGTYEYGNVFKPKVNGKITALSCLMPDIDIYSVTLWDSASKSVLASENINNLDTINPNSKAITPIKVIAGKSYIITVKSVNKRWFEITTKKNGTIPYPMSNQYIKLTGYLWTSTTIGDPSKFPTNISTTYIAGLADFSFLPD